MNRSQSFAGAVLAAVLLGIVLQPTLGSGPAIVIAVAVAAAIDAGGRVLRRRGDGRSRERPPDDGDPMDGGHSGA